MTSRRSWVPLLAGLLVAGVLGVGGGGAVAAAPGTVTETIMVPAAAFSPTKNNPAQPLFTYDPDGMTAVTVGSFLAWVPLPAKTEVTLQRFRLYAFDNTAEAYWGVCLQVHRVVPNSASHELLAGGGAEACTAGGASTEDPQVILINAFYGDSARLISTHRHALLLWVTLSPSTVFYGVQVTYSYNPGA